MLEAGLIQHWQNKWFPKGADCTGSESVGKQEQITLSHAQGAFYLLGIGILIALILLLVEHIVANQIQRYSLLQRIIRSLDKHRSQSDPSENEDQTVTHITDDGEVFSNSYIVKYSDTSMFDKYRVNGQTCTTNPVYTQNYTANPVYSQTYTNPVYSNHVYTSHDEDVMSRKERKVGSQKHTNTTKPKETNRIILRLHSLRTKWYSPDSTIPDSPGSNNSPNVLSFDAPDQSVTHL